MANIGKFTKIGEGYTGHITLLQTEIGARLEPVTDKTSDKSPDFHLIIKDKAGAGWKRKSTKHAEEFLSVAIDDLPGLNVALFKAEDGSYDLVVRKPAKK